MYKLDKVKNSETHHSKTYISHNIKPLTRFNTVAEWSSWIYDLFLCSDSDIYINTCNMHSKPIVVSLDNDTLRLFYCHY